MPAPSAPRAASTRPCPAARECRVPPVVRAGVGRCGRGCRRSGHAGSGARRRCARVRCGSAPESSAPCVARRRSGGGSGAARGTWSTSVCGWPRPSASPGNSSACLWSHQGGRALSPPSIAGEGRKSAMSNQRLMKAKEKTGDGYAKTNAIALLPARRWHASRSNTWSDGLRPGSPARAAWWRRTCVPRSFPPSAAFASTPPPAPTWRAGSTPTAAGIRAGPTAATRSCATCSPAPPTGGIAPKPPAIPATASCATAVRRAGACSAQATSRSSARPCADSTTRSRSTSRRSG